MTGVEVAHSSSRDEKLLASFYSIRGFRFVIFGHGGVEERLKFFDRWCCTGLLLYEDIAYSNGAPWFRRNHGAPLEYAFSLWRYGKLRGAVKICDIVR